MGRRRDDHYDEPRNPPRTEPIAPTRTPPADVPELADKSARIAWIVDRMRELAWPVFPHSLAYRQRLAIAWGVSESTVRDYSAEAHRVIQLDPVDRAMVAYDIARTMDAITQDALATVNEQTGLPDYASAIRAQTEKARFLGAEPPKEVKVTGSVSLATLDELRRALDDDGVDRKALDDGEPGGRSG
jgi:hypothetical protein